MGRFTAKFKSAALIDAALSFCIMPQTFKAHYDGARVVLDEPMNVPVGAPLLITMLESPSEDDWHQKWHHAVATVAEEELEYTSQDSSDKSRTIQVWRLITHHENRDSALRWSLQNGRLAIGWGRIGDIGDQEFSSETEIAAAILHAYESGKHPLNNSKAGGFSLWNLLKQMKIGDLVILRGSSFSRVVKITGDYFFDAQNTPISGDFYNHQRCVEVTPINPEMLWQRAGKMAKDGGSIYRTLIRCERRLSPEDLLV